MSRKSRKEQKMKKQMRTMIIVGVSVLVCMAALLIGLASGNENLGNHDHDHEHEHAQEVELNVAVSFAEGSMHYNSIVQFKEEVEKLSNGTIAVNIFGSGKLGSGSGLVQALQKGSETVDVIVADVEDYTLADPRMDISSLPFAFGGYEAAWAFMEGNAQESIEEDLKRNNIHVLAYFSDGFDYILTGNKSITQSVDLKYMNLVADEGTKMAPVMGEFGATVNAVEKNQLAHMLSAKQVDGYIGSLEQIYSGNLYIGQNFIAATYHRYHAQALSISESVWKSLTEEQQKIVQKAAENSALSDCNTMQQQEKTILKNLESAGLRVTYPNTESLKKKVESFLSSYSSKYGALIDRIIHN